VVCRVPLIWRVPGAAKAGHVSRQLVENVDIAPTLASLCGLPPMDTVDGRDLAPLVAGEDKPLREVAVTENPWSKALRWGPWRFVHYQREMFHGDVGELYNLEKDPDETRNLYTDPAHQTVAGECRRLLLEWLIRTTRVVSAWPPPKGMTQASEAAGGDGKESNQYGPAERVRRGAVYYI
jgi:arylsulfatase A-like enzyme